MKSLGFKFLPQGIVASSPGSSVGKESACSAGDPGSIPGLRRFPGEGNGNSLQYSCLENPWTMETGGPWGHQASDRTWWLNNNNNIAF